MTAYLITGDDESILRSGVQDLVHRLIGEGDRTLMVDEFDGEEYELRWLVDAAQTPPFLTESRIVVGRGIGRFTTDELTPLVNYLSDPLPSTELVLVAGGGRIPKSLTDAVKLTGGVTTNTTPPTRAKDRQAWIAEKAEEAGVRFDPSATARVAGWLGEDVGRLDGILATLVSTYGTNRRLVASDVEPFLGEAGGVPPWEFTDAVDAGETTKALTLLERMMRGGDRHPLVVMAVLHSHYGKLARLDGVDAGSETDAADAMGIKPGFPARKALANYRRLGGGGIQRAIQLLAQADLDLRGDRDLPHDLVMEVLVARLSRLGARAR
jgi:DNA polymerase-3 subunit delta